MHAIPTELGMPVASGAREFAPDPQEAASLFRGHQQQVYERTDRLFAHLMAAQWLAGILFALMISPRAWAGSTSQLHIHVWAAVFLGGAISLFPALLALTRPGLPSTRYTIGTAQMLMSALLIHLTGGRIETHFHVFGSLAFLAFYRDWRVLVPATIVVALDHFLRGVFWPQSVYGVVLADDWRWLEHAGWVVFEDIFLVMACIRGTEELRQIADRTSSLKQANLAQERHGLELAGLVARLRLSQQEAEAATRAKSEFVANMSHELRTPLNAITLYSDLLQDSARADGRADDVADIGRIQTSSKHLLELINGILDLSKIEAGKMELDLDTFAVEALVAELVRAIDAVVRQNGNTFAVTCDANLGSMHADITKTRQILFNLLSNAAKFTKNGAVSLHVSRRRTVGGDYVEFTVADTGIGLADEQTARLFRPFSQVDASVSRKYGGTGLGLALVWRFCKLMGGDVTVSSVLGQGARFVVVLPSRVELAADAPASSAA